MSEELQSTNRIKVFDLFRTYGCIAIILLHVITAWRDDPVGAEAFKNLLGIRMFFDNGIVPLLVRMAVPIFFMMSGALFLNPDRNMTWEKIKKHVIKLLITLGFFGYLMSIAELIVANKTFEISYLWESILNLIQEETWSHLWYLYATIGLYLITPILRAWIEKTDRQGFRRGILGAIILLSVIPSINSLTRLKITTFGLSTVRGALLCYLLGYYLYSEKDKIRIIWPGIIVGGY